MGPEDRASRRASSDPAGRSEQTTATDPLSRHSSSCMALWVGSRAAEWGDPQAALVASAAPLLRLLLIFLGNLFKELLKDLGWLGAADLVLVDEKVWYAVNAPCVCLQLGLHLLL